MGWLWSCVCSLCRRYVHEPLVQVLVCQGRTLVMLLRRSLSPRTTCLSGLRVDETVNQLDINQSDCPALVTTAAMIAAIRRDTYLIKGCPREKRHCLKQLAMKACNYHKTCLVRQC